MSSKIINVIMMKINIVIPCRARISFFAASILEVNKNYQHEKTLQTFMRVVLVTKSLLNCFAKAFNGKFTMIKCNMILI